ncbi:hypothetical protein GCM10029964_093100 [Kibdelosporangium lantanae]
MPRNQSTNAKRARAAGGKYTAALRAEQQASAPPVLVPITSTWCEPGCDGSPHPGASCKSWEPCWDSLRHGRATAMDRDTASRAFAAYQAASLPGERPESLVKRFLDRPPFESAQWLLKLIYAMLLEDQPELTPDPRKLRAAVETADLAGVDEAMQPLDRAAVALLDHDPDHWWKTVHPRLTAFAERILDDPAFEVEFCDVTVLYRRQRTLKLAERWLKAQVERRNWDGYMERESIIWHQMQPALAAVLTERAGGYSREATVEVDGTPMRVVASIWGPDGPPIAYQVVPMTSSGWVLDRVRVDAAAVTAPGSSVAS